MRIGKNVKIYPTAKIIGNVSIGDDVIIDDFVFINASGEEFEIGSNVHISSFTSIVGSGKCVIEDFVGISGGVRIYTSNEDYFGGCLTNPTVPEPFRKKESGLVSIGRHVLIGANSVVIPITRIGEGAVVGALSFVKGFVDPWTVYAGSPLRKLYPRRDDQILRLEQEYLATKKVDRA